MHYSYQSEMGCFRSVGCSLIDQKKDYRSNGIMLEPELGNTISGRGTDRFTIKRPSLLCVSRTEDCAEFRQQSVL